MADEEARQAKLSTIAVEMLRSRFNAQNPVHRQIADWTQGVEPVKTINGPEPPEPSPEDAPVRDSPPARASCVCNFCRDNKTEIVVDKII
nr:hypothetical protein [Cressdnaviricota sp.]UOF82987.1 hypothetical protein [Cressdnaviricota sp.]UOF83110.1 hypothetical protein [Cressdnaviricota sp.]